MISPGLFWIIDSRLIDEDIFYISSIADVYCCSGIVVFSGLLCFGFVSYGSFAQRTKSVNIILFSFRHKYRHVSFFLSSSAAFGWVYPVHSNGSGIMIMTSVSVLEISDLGSDRIFLSSFSIFYQTSWVCGLGVITRRFLFDIINGYYLILFHVYHLLWVLSTTTKTIILNQ